MSPGVVDADPQKSSSAAAILELVNIAAQLARVDQMIAQVTDGTPEADEAKQWHEISLQALKCSRDMLSQKQMQCLAGLRSEIPEAGAQHSEVSKTPASPPVLPPWRQAKVMEVSKTSEL